MMITTTSKLWFAALMMNIGLSATAFSQKMQHGFIVGQEDAFLSHLVAKGHHSWQTTISGELSIPDESESRLFAERRAANEESPTSYFLFQAQGLDLTTIKEGQVLEGHIIESALGEYEPKRVLIENATFTIDQVLINMSNPFFRTHHHPAPKVIRISASKQGYFDVCSLSGREGQQVSSTYEEKLNAEKNACEESGGTFENGEIRTKVNRVRGGMADGICSLAKFSDAVCRK